MSEAKNFIEQIVESDLAEQKVKTVKTMLFDMRQYLEGGREVYPLAEALEDAYVWTLMEKAVKDPGAVVESQAMPWHKVMPKFIP